MKVIILAGGFGSRLAEETTMRPKPMVEIGGKPILWHIMSTYAAYGFCEFIIALGYKGEMIKEYFLNFFALNNDISIDLSNGDTTIHGGRQPNWRVHLVDTGLRTLTGGRLKRLKSWLKDDETFMLTYGDGVANVDIRALTNYHASHGKQATVTLVHPPARFGNVVLDGQRIAMFAEKSQTAAGLINGGFFVLNKATLDCIEGDSVSWEREPLETLARNGELMGYVHEGFWQPMDTLREKQFLDELWERGDAPWKVWK